MKAFGSKDLEKCVKKLGFVFDSISSSHHAKYIPPSGRDPLPGVRPFFIIQLGRRSYDSYSANRYLTELKHLGFSKEEIEKALK